MDAPYECTKCKEQIWSFRQDNYAGSAIIVCPACGCIEIIETQTGKLYENRYDLPGTWS